MNEEQERLKIAEAYDAVRVLESALRRVLHLHVEFECEMARGDCNHESAAVIRAELDFQTRRAERAEGRLQLATKMTGDLLVAPPLPDAGRVKVLEDALRDVWQALQQTHVNYCNEAWTDRGLHAPECLAYEADAILAALSPKKGQP